MKIIRTLKNGNLCSGDIHCRKAGLVADSDGIDWNLKDAPAFVKAGYKTQNGECDGIIVPAGHGLRRRGIGGESRYRFTVYEILSR